MVVRVKLEGLNIVRPRGKWYVYIRETGKPLLKGFTGSQDDLVRRLAEPDLIAAYNALRKRDLKHSYPDGTLGALIQWFENDCPEFARLSEATKKDYRAAFLYLRDEWDAPVSTITQNELYKTRDTCSQKKWPRFADKMISALSSLFTQAARRGKIQGNPAKGISKAHKADPNANREWRPEEFKAAIARAPAHLKTVLMLARYAGFRGQTISVVQWKDYQVDPKFGKCFRLVARKNGEPIYVPARPELQAHLATLTTNVGNISLRHDGKPWKDEVQMQTAISHFLKPLERSGVLGAGVTLHGLRVTFAAKIVRDGHGNSEAAAALGDRSERMGKHYTRNVESEVKIIRAFTKKRR